MQNTVLLSDMPNALFKMPAMPVAPPVAKWLGVSRHCAANAIKKEDASIATIVLNQNAAPVVFAGASLGRCFVV